RLVEAAGHPRPETAGIDDLPAGADAGPEVDGVAARRQPGEQLAHAGAEPIVRVDDRVVDVEEDVHPIAARGRPRPRIARARVAGDPASPAQITRAPPRTLTVRGGARHTPFHPGPAAPDRSRRTRHGPTPAQPPPHLARRLVPVLREAQPAGARRRLHGVRGLHLGGRSGPDRREPAAFAAALSP